MPDPISSSSNYSSSSTTGGGASDAYPTVLGPDASFKGELTFEKGMRLMGRFEGKITTPGRLQVSREAHLSADVDAGAITVEGDVRGNLVAADRIELKSTARYEGDLRTTKLVVEEGAVFTGNVSVGPESVKKTSRSTSSSAAFNAPIPAPSTASTTNGAATPAAASK